MKNNRLLTMKVLLLLLGFCGSFAVGLWSSQISKTRQIERKTISEEPFSNTIVPRNGGHGAIFKNVIEPVHPAVGNRMDKLNEHLLLSECAAASTRPTRLHRLIGRIYLLEYEDCKSLVENLKAERFRHKKAVMAALVGRMAQFGGSATADYVADNFSEYEQINLLRSVIENWNENPDEVFRWWSAQRNSRDWTLRHRRQTAKYVWEKYAEQTSVDSAFDLLESIELNNSEIRGAIGGIVLAEPFANFEDILRRIRSIEDEAIRSNAEMRLVINAGANDMLGTLKKLEEAGLSDKYRDQVLDIWMPRSSLPADYLYENSNDPPKTTIERIVSQWASTDPTAASHWIDGLVDKITSPGDLDDGLVVLAASFARFGQVDAAIEQVAKITQPRTRQRVLRDIILEIFRIDLPSAKSLLESDLFSPNTRAEISRIFEHLEVNE